MCQQSLETRLFQAAVNEWEQLPSRGPEQVAQQQTQLRPILNKRNIIQHTNLPYRSMETQMDNELRPMVVNNYYTAYSGYGTSKRTD